MEFKSSWSQFALFLMLLGVNMIVFTTFAGVTADFLVGSVDLSSVPVSRYINTLSQIGIFGFTAYGFAFFVNRQSPFSYLQVNKVVGMSVSLILMLGYVVSIPAMSWLIEWNEGLKLPESLSSIEFWMRENEIKNATTADRLLSGTGINTLLINLLVMGLVPAICEELLFRGALLGWLKKSLKNIHVAVFLSAFIFSAIHMQFFGFFPRLLLGLYLGYLCVWTGSIWGSVIVHFINNIIIVITAYLYHTEIISTHYKDFGSVENNYMLIFVSVVLTGICIYFLYKKRKKKDILSEF